jgi:CheY-like chemotaxis protein
MEMQGLVDTHDRLALISLNVNLPVSNGLDGLARIRVKPERGRLPAIMVTSDRSQQDVR